METTGRTESRIGGTIRNRRTAAPEEQNASGLARWSGPAFVAGGLLWIAHYEIWVTLGLVTGDVPVWGTAFAGESAGPVGYLDLTSFCGAILFFAAGLYGVGVVLKGRSKVLRAIGLFFAVLAGIMAASGLATQALGLASMTGLFMGNGVIASLLGATFLSGAALRTGALRKGAALLLLANGLLTFPLIVSIVSILPTLPSYTVDELPFAVSGLAWILVGRALLPKGKATSA